MMEQNCFETRGPVLDENGIPIPGYSTRSMRDYDRSAIRANPLRIKEWDWYQVNNDHLCLQFTYGHAAYVGQADVMLFDFRSGEKIFEAGNLIPLALNRMKLDKDAEKNSRLLYRKPNLTMSLVTENDVRRLQFHSRDGHGEVVLKRKNPHSLVITIPFDEKPTQFYYNHKISSMTASGYVTWKGETYVFDEADSFGLLDWGRGVWPYHNEWYWSSASGYYNDRMISFNLGCGFGNPSAATENIVFHDGTYTKYGNVTFECDRSDFMKTWRIRDEEGKIDLSLDPVYDRLTKTKAAWIDNITHQMFGGFRGTIELKTGEVLQLDGTQLISFAELAVNNW